MPLLISRDNEHLALPLLQELLNKHHVLLLTHHLGPLVPFLVEENEGRGGRRREGGSGERREKEREGKRGRRRERGREGEGAL